MITAGFSTSAPLVSANFNGVRESTSPLSLGPGSLRHQLQFPLQVVEGLLDKKGRNESTQAPYLPVPAPSPWAGIGAAAGREVQA